MTETSADITDIALADSGRKRIDWAFREMPVVRQIIERFDHKHLNLDTEEFARLNPSVEHIARICHDLLVEPLAEAGLTHVHLLPSFDIATVNEDRSQWQAPDASILETYPPDSDQQQAAVTATAEDGGDVGHQLSMLSHPVNLLTSQTVCSWIWP